MVAIVGWGALGTYLVVNALRESDAEQSNALAEVDRLLASAEIDAREAGADFESCTLEESFWVQKWAGTFLFGWSLDLDKDGVNDVSELGEGYCRAFLVTS